MQMTALPARRKQIESSSSTVLTKPTSQDGAQNFKFITSSGPHDTKLDRRTLKAVRSHVMRRFQQERRQKGSEEIYASHDANELGKTLSSLQATQSRVNEEPEDERVVELYGRSFDGFDLSASEILDWTSRMPRSSLESCRSDPFKILPVAMDSHSTSLLDFFQWIYPGKAGIPVHGAKSWLSHMLSHKTTTHAILFFSALAYRQHDTNSSFGTTEWHRHVLGAIQSVNEALNNEEERYSDAVIAAILLLARNEVIVANFDSARGHFKALQIIVKARGGLQALGWNGVLAKLIFWVDNFWSVFTLTPPLFPLVVVQEINPKTGKSRIRIQDAKIDSPILVSLEPTSLAHALKDISQQSATRLHFKSEEFLEAYSERLIYLEFRLASWIRARHWDSDEHLSAVEIIYQAFYVTALMYIYIVLREQTITHHHFAILLRCLTSILTRLHNIPDFSSSRATTTPHPVNVFYWSLFVGAVTSEGGPHELYFVEMLTELSSRQNVRSWDHARELLKEVAWLSRVCEVRWKSVWDKMTLNQWGKGYGPKLLWFQEGWKYQDGWKTFEQRTEDNLLT